MNKTQLKTLNLLTLFLLLCMGFASCMGIFNESTYLREQPSLAAQGVGQDIVNLFVGGPILLLALLFMNRGNKTASWIFAGMVFYYLYSYIIYTFGIHHNKLFLVYCATLALSTYTFIFWIYYNAGQDIKSWFSKAPPVRFTAIFILAIAAMFYMIWLKDIVPPLLNGEAPAFVIEIVLVFTIILAIALIGMMVMVLARGLSDDMSLAYIFAVLALIAGVVFTFFLRGLKKSD